MGNLSKILVLFCGASLLAVAGCGDDGGGGNPADAGGSDAAAPDAPLPDAPLPDAAIAPPLRNPVDLADDELAAQALALLGVPGGAVDQCENCHGMTRQYVRYWRALSDETLASCLTDPDVSTPAAARDMIGCLRMTPGDTDTPFEASRLGVYSAAAHLDWFEFLFRIAYPDSWEVELQAFTDRVAMPRGEHPPYTQAEFDVVAEWFARGLPRLDDLLPLDPPPTECTPGVSADVAAHVADMALTGWRASNAENNLLMFGCGGASSTRKCLLTYPDAGDLPIGAGWAAMPDTVLKVLSTQSASSAYWARSSADGRYIGWGSGAANLGSTLVDLVSDSVIGIDAFYDPSFFPDNSGFMYQGAGARLCDHSVLASNPTEIRFDEPECNTTGQIGLYEHLGAALGGGDYWAVFGQFVSDNGGHSPTLSDPAAYFSSASTVRLTPMIHEGTAYVPGTTVTLSAPFEGDTVIAPSAQLLVSRVAGPDDRQIGFVLRKLIATPGPGGYTVVTPEIARYCTNGGKPSFSFDERFLVLHHYVTAADAVDLGYSGPGDPGFQPYLSQGAANIYLIDLVTGERTRVTRMSPGQYALFPHFRSDGWFYFIVRTIANSTEYVVASDAALELDGTP